MRPSQALSNNRVEILQIFSKYPVKNPMVFGSVARGEDTDSSDLDLLVERDGKLTYFDMARIEHEISELTGCKVGVHTLGEFLEDSKKHVSHDARLI